MLSLVGRAYQYKTVCQRWDWNHKPSERQKEKKNVVELEKKLHGVLFLSHPPSPSCPPTTPTELECCLVSLERDCRFIRSSRKFIPTKAWEILLWEVNMGSRNICLHYQAFWLGKVLKELMNKTFSLPREAHCLVGEADINNTVFSS